MAKYIFLLFIDVSDNFQSWSLTNCAVRFWFLLIFDTLNRICFLEWYISKLAFTCLSSKILYFWNNQNSCNVSSAYLNNFNMMVVKGFQRWYKRNEQQGQDDFHSEPFLKRRWQSLAVRRSVRLSLHMRPNVLAIFRPFSLILFCIVSFCLLKYKC